MADANPRRLGFFIMALLAAIFAPMLFDGAGLKESKLDLEIPKPPAFPVMQIDEPRNPRLIDTRDVAEPSVQQEELKQPRMASTPAVLPPTTPHQSNNPPSEKVEPVSAQPRVEASLSVAKEVPVLDKQGVPVAWTLQLAAFKQHDNAESLRDKLHKAGFKAYIRQKNQLSVVFVGPDIQRSELEKVQKQLSKDLKLNGLILRFTTS